MTHNCEHDQAWDEGNADSLLMSESSDAIKQSLADVNIEAKQNHVFFVGSPYSLETPLGNSEYLPDVNTSNELDSTVEASDLTPQPSTINDNLDDCVNELPNKPGKSTNFEHSLVDIPFKSFINEDFTCDKPDPSLVNSLNYVNDDSQLSSCSSKGVPNHNDHDCGSRDSFTQSDVEPSDLRKELLAALTRQQTNTPDSDLHSFATTASFEDAYNEGLVEPIKSPKSDSSEDEENENESLSYELKIGLRILKEFLVEANKSLTWPFLNAVDPERDGVEDYYEKVPSPMWFNKMKEKFLSQEYSSITEFVSDFRLMLENCYRYNGPDHPISKKAQRLETMLEQKLSLLSRDLREKTSIAPATGLALEEKQITGTRRRKVLVPHDSTALLNQLRLEQLEREKEARRTQMMERKQQQEAALREIDDWEDSLLQSTSGVIMRHCWEIPQIGHFLFLCMGALNIGEVMQFELERCFAMPKESATMQKVMTALLSTPYQRTKLNRKPMMPYKVWEEKLRVRMRHWYKVLKDCHLDLTKACNKLGLDEKIFKVLGLRSPMEKKKYHELSFYQRIWIMKSLCDWCLENQESLREAIEAQPEAEQRSYHLGVDAKGNSYINFPQFCGADVRIYRHAPIEMPTLDIPPQTKNSSRRKNQSKRSSLSKKALTLARRIKQKAELAAVEKPKEPRDSRLRKNPKQIQTYAEMDSTTEDSNVTGEEEEEEEENESETRESPESSEADSGISESEAEDPPVRKVSRSTRKSGRQQTRMSSRQTSRRDTRQSDARSPSVSSVCESSATTPVIGRMTRSAWKKCIEESTPTNSRASTPMSSTSNRKPSRNNTPVEFDTVKTSKTSKLRAKAGQRRSGRTRGKVPDADESISFTATSQKTDDTMEDVQPSDVDTSVREAESSFCDTKAIMDKGKECGDISRDLCASERGPAGENVEDIELTSQPVPGNKSCDEETLCDSSTERLACDNRHSGVMDQEGTKSNGDSNYTGPDSMNNIVEHSGEGSAICSPIELSHSPVLSGKTNAEETSCDTTLRSQSPTSGVHKPVAHNLDPESESGFGSSSKQSYDECVSVCGDSDLIPSVINMKKDSIGSDGDHAEHKPDTVDDITTKANLTDDVIDDSKGKTTNGTSGTSRTIASNNLIVDENLCLGNALVYNKADIDGVPSSMVKADAHSDLETSEVSRKDDVGGSKADISGLDLLLAAAEKDMTAKLEFTETKTDKCKLEESGTKTGKVLKEEDSSDLQNATESVVIPKQRDNSSDEANQVKVESGEAKNLQLLDGRDEVKMEKYLKTQTCEGTVKTEVEEFKEEKEGSSETKQEPVTGQCVGETEALEVKEELDSEIDVEPEILGPDLNEFKLVVDSVESLRKLAEEFEELPPIVTGSGKRERVVTSTPRKKCEKDLLSRLLFLVKELEPWEHKLMSANRRAKLRMKKEKENYVEEKEREQMEFWVSEPEVSSDEDDRKSESSSYDPFLTHHDFSSRMGTRSSSGKRDRKKPALDMKEEDSQDTYMEHTEEYGVSSKGRIRKRRVIPNNVEDQSLQPKKTKSMPRHERPALLSKGGKSNSGSVMQAGSLTTTSQTNKLKLPHLSGGVTLNASGSNTSVANQTLLIRSPGAGPQGGKQYIQISGNVALKNPAVLSQLLAGKGNIGKQILVQGNPGQDTQKLIQAILSHKKQQQLQNIPKTTVFQPFQFKTGDARSQHQSAVTSIQSLQSMNSASNALSQQVKQLQFQQVITTGQALQPKSKEELVNQNLSVNLQQTFAQRNTAVAENTLTTPQNIALVVTQAQAVIPPHNVMTSPQKVTQVARIMTSQGIKTIPLSQLPSPIIAQLSKLQSGQNIRLQLAAASSTASAQTGSQRVQQVQQVVRPNLSLGGALTVASTCVTLSGQSTVRVIPSPVKTPQEKQVCVSTAEVMPRKLVELTSTAAAVSVNNSVVVPSEASARPVNKYAASMTVKELLAKNNRTSTTKGNITATLQPAEGCVSGSIATETVLESDRSVETKPQNSVDGVVESSQVVQLQSTSQVSEDIQEPQVCSATRLQVSGNITDTKPLLKSGAKIAVLKKTPQGTKQVMMDASNLQLLIAKKQAIDRAVKQVVTEAPTTLPTANIKVSSPFPMPTRQPHRPCTVATSSMKHPIPSVCPLLPGDVDRVPGSEENTQSSPGMIATSSVLSSSESLLKTQKISGSSETTVKMVSSNSISSIPSSAVRVISTETLTLNRQPNVKATCSASHVVGTIVSSLQAIAPHPAETAGLVASPTQIITSNNSPKLIVQQQQASSQTAGPQQHTVMLQRQVINTAQGPVQGVILPQNIMGGGVIQKTKDGLVLMQKSTEHKASAQTVVQQGSVVKSTSGVVIAQGMSHLSGGLTASKLPTGDSGNKFRAIAVANPANMVSVQASSASSQNTSQVLVSSAHSLSESVKAIQPKIHFQIAPQQQQQQQLIVQQKLSTNSDVNSVQQRTNLQAGVVVQQPRMMLVNVNGQLMAHPIGSQLKVAQVGQNVSSLPGVQIAQLNQASTPSLGVVGGTPLVHASNTQQSQTAVVTGSQGTTSVPSSNPSLALLSGSQLLGSNVQLAQVNQQQVAIVGGTQLAQGNPTTPLLLAPQLVQQPTQQLGVLQPTQFQIQTPQGPMAVIGGGGQVPQLSAVQLQQASGLVQNALPQQMAPGHQQNQQQQNIALVQPQFVQTGQVQTQVQAISSVTPNTPIKQLQLVTGNPAAVLQLQPTAVTSSQ